MWKTFQIPAVQPLRLSPTLPGVKVTTGLGFFLHSTARLIYLTPCQQAYISLLTEIVFDCDHISIVTHNTL